MESETQSTVPPPPSSEPSASSAAPDLSKALLLLNSASDQSQLTPQQLLDILQHGSRSEKAKLLLNENLVRELAAGEQEVVRFFCNLDNHDADVKAAIGAFGIIRQGTFKFLTGKNLLTHISDPDTFNNIINNAPPELLVQAIDKDILRYNKLTNEHIKTLLNKGDDEINRRLFENDSFKEKAEAAEAELRAEAEREVAEAAEAAFKSKVEYANDRASDITYFIEQLPELEKRVNKYLPEEYEIDIVPDANYRVAIHTLTGLFAAGGNLYIGNKFKFLSFSLDSISFVMNHKTDWLTHENPYIHCGLQTVDNIVSTLSFFNPNIVAPTAALFYARCISVGFEEYLGYKNAVRIDLVLQSIQDGLSYANVGSFLSWLVNVAKTIDNALTLGSEVLLSLEPGVHGALEDHSEEL
ncbi:MAG: hypothetical protein K0T99_02050 [Alphaproteobacteria bacterium]|nr:hypothetical protein [Alphaproteobacteria bacterium]